MAIVQWFTIMASWMFATGTVYTGGNLTVDIKGFKTDKGYVLISVFNSASGFPGSAEKAYIKERAAVKDGSCVVTFPSLPEGTYAIAVLHDENKNLKMDTKLLMLPKEGFGFSQNGMVLFGPPSFNKASFRHNGVQEIVINMKYF